MTVRTHLTHEDSCRQPAVCRRTCLFGASALMTAAVLVPPAVAADLLDLMARGKVKAEVSGSGIQSVSIRLRRMVPEPLDVTLQVGLYFVASRGSTQNMVGTAARSVSLTSDQWVEVSLPAACANKPRDIPVGADTFTIQRAPRQRELAIALPALERAGAAYPVVQAATWMITDDATFDGLGTLVRRRAGQSSGRTRVIQENEAAGALRIMADAGLDVTRLAVWRDRARIANGVTDPSLAGWLRGR